MRKKALLVGINKYRIPGADLSGCVNDVTNIRDVLLKHFGFTVPEIRVIVDERATKKNIMDRLRWLVDGAKPGDKLLFHFSGHGSQIRDREGDELKDHMDEILCPHDMDWDGTFITDDELRELFGTLPDGVVLDVILDCCHSGTGTREAIVYAGEMGSEGAWEQGCGGEGVQRSGGAGERGSRGAEGIRGQTRIVPRFLRPPVDIECRVEDDLPIRRILRGSGSGVQMKHVLYAACRDNQTAADAYIGGRYNGAFTYFLCRRLRDANGDVTRGELVRRVRESLRYHGFGQIPQLEGPRERRQKKVLE
ncbi:MAG: caspase family protein [Candidatus Bathyarchaeia archaeon]